MPLCVCQRFCYRFLLFFPVFRRVHYRTITWLRRPLTNEPLLQCARCRVFEWLWGKYIIIYKYWLNRQSSYMYIYAYLLNSINIDLTIHSEQSAYVMSYLPFIPTGQNQWTCSGDAVDTVSLWLKDCSIVSKHQLNIRDHCEMKEWAILQNPFEKWWGRIWCWGHECGIIIWQGMNNCRQFQCDLQPDSRLINGLDIQVAVCVGEIRQTS